MKNTLKFFTKDDSAGESNSICANPQTEYTKKLINAIPKGELEDIKARMEGKENLS